MSHGESLGSPDHQFVAGHRHQQLSRGIHHHMRDYFLVMARLFGNAPLRAVPLPDGAIANPYEKQLFACAANTGDLPTVLLRLNLLIIFVQIDNFEFLVVPSRHQVIIVGHQGDGLDRILP